jgi:hypothetical protein
MRRTRCTILAALVAALLPLARAEAQSGIGIEEIRAWIAEHHAEVYKDTTANTVIFVVDTNGKYVRSLAAQLDSAEVATTDFRFRRLEELIAAREGRRQVDTLLSDACSSASDAQTRRPVCILDGRRVGSFEPLQMMAVRDLETVNGAEATARYGQDGANGVVIATSAPRMLERLSGLGATSANFGGIQMNRVRAGVVGPRRLDILIMFLKPPKT